MRPEIKQKIRNAYFDYSDYLDGVEVVMTGYLGALNDLGLITEDEYFKAVDDLYKAKNEVA